jgi:hypothetical protein
MNKSQRIILALDALADVINDVQKYDLQIRPAFAQQLELLVQDGVKAINELEEEEKNAEQANQEAAAAIAIEEEVDAI